MIYTNWKNVTIGFGTTFNFSDSGCFVVNGGSFICGDIVLTDMKKNYI